MNEDHPFEVACKLARSLYDRRQAAGIRAEIALAKFYAGKHHAPAIGGRKYHVRDAESLGARIYSHFNGHPVSLDALCRAFPEAKRDKINRSVSQLVYRGRLESVTTGVYRKPHL